MQLDPVVRLLEERRLPAALETMLELWREHRSVALADCIDLLGDALTRVLPPIAGSTRKQFQSAWLDVANQKRSLDVGRLVASFRTPPWTLVGDRIERLSLLDDPRVAITFARFAADLPTVGSILASRWTLLFKTIERIADRRVQPALEAFLARADQRTHVVEHLKPQAHGVLERIAEAQPVAELALLDLHARILEATQHLPTAGALLAEAPRPRVRASEAELLDVIYERPEDDAPRLVYSDWLQEQGDSRAALLSLQMKAVQTGKDQQRARQLIRTHGREWLGVLEPAIHLRGLHFTRGFASKATTTFVSQGLRSQLFGHPAWNTFTELTADVPELLEQTELRGLERLADLGAPGLEALTRRKRPLRRLHSLGLFVPVTALHQVNAIDAPGLESLHLRLQHPVPQYIVPRLKELGGLLERLVELHVLGTDGTALLDFGLGHARLRRFRMGRDIVLEFHRLAQGWVLDVIPMFGFHHRIEQFSAALTRVVAVAEPSPALWGTACETARAVMQRAMSTRVPWVSREVLEAVAP